MTTPVVICDDSKMARRQMARVLPPDWDVELTFATNGQEALDAVEAGRGEVLLLDLTMPVMDGFETLRALRERGAEARVIVVSGDVQADAQRRVRELGALDFLRKPVNGPQLLQSLERLGILGERTAGGVQRPGVDIAVDTLDCCQEVANVAMGRAVAQLAELLEVFVVLSVPRVNLLERGELEMALQHADEHASVSAVCQGYIGAGIAGEALLIFHDSSYPDIARLMGFEGELDENAEIELLMDTANVLVGACLQGVADQLDLQFNQAPPVVLGRHCKFEDLINASTGRWQRTLAIEVGCTIEGHQVTCDLLLLFSDDSIQGLERKMGKLV